MGEKVRLHWKAGITVHDFAYKAVNYTVLKWSAIQPVGTFSQYE